MLSFLSDMVKVVKWALVGVEASILVRFARVTGGRQSARRVLRSCARVRKDLLDSLIR